MDRSHPLKRWLHLPILLGGMASCSLLEDYPGGEDPAAVIAKPPAGIPGAQDPLVNPEEDPSVSVLNLLDATIALPGTGFPISLSFQAPGANVIGGGIRLEGSDEVQWTLLQKVKGEKSGTIEFAYVLPADVCDSVANLCHTIETEQFAVTSDGSGGFAVSPPEPVTVVLQCATCDSASCVEVLPPGSCRSCEQPESCQVLYEACYAPGAPSEGSETASLFELFMGAQGLLWTSTDGCFQGDALCEATTDGGSCDF